MILAFTSLFALLSSYLNNMAIFCLPQNCLSDNSNFTIAHIAQLAEHFHGKEEVVRSIRTVGTTIILIYFYLKFFVIFKITLYVFIIFSFQFLFDTFSTGRA